MNYCYSIYYFPIIYSVRSGSWWRQMIEAHMASSTNETTSPHCPYCLHEATGWAVQRARQAASLHPVANDLETHVLPVQHSQQLWSPGHSLQEIIDALPDIGIVVGPPAWVSSGVPSSSPTPPCPTTAAVTALPSVLTAAAEGKRNDRGRRS